ncbi:MAG: hypothetical protein EZS28_038554, partial [Streblomastix strix]
MVEGGNGYEQIFHDEKDEEENFDDDEDKQIEGFVKAKQKLKSKTDVWVNTPSNEYYEKYKQQQANPPGATGVTQLLQSMVQSSSSELESLNASSLKEFTEMRTAIAAGPLKSAQMISEQTEQQSQHQITSNQIEIQQPQTPSLYTEMSHQISSLKEELLSLQLSSKQQQIISPQISSQKAEQSQKAEETSVPVRHLSPSLISGLPGQQLSQIQQQLQLNTSNAAAIANMQTGQTQTTQNTSSFTQQGSLQQNMSTIGLSQITITNTIITAVNSSTSIITCWIWCKISIAINCTKKFNYQHEHAYPTAEFICNVTVINNASIIIVTVNVTSGSLQRSAQIFQLTAELISAHAISNSVITVTAPIVIITRKPYSWIIRNWVINIISECKCRPIRRIWGDFGAVSVYDIVSCAVVDVTSIVAVVVVIASQEEEETEHGKGFLRDIIVDEAWEVKLDKDLTKLQ